MRRSELSGAASVRSRVQRPSEFEKGDRWVEKGDGAAAPGSLACAAQDDVEAGPGKSERGREPGQPRAGDQDVRGARGRRFVVGHRRSPAGLPESPDARPNDRGDGAAQL